MKLRPLGKNLLIQPIAAAKVSAGGIVLPQGEKTGASQGEVLAVASGVDERLELKAGARVLYARSAHMQDAGEGRQLLSSDDVLAVLG